MALKLFSANSVGCFSPMPRERGGGKEGIFFFSQSGRFSAQEINVGKEHSWELGTV